MGLEEDIKQKSFKSSHQKGLINIIYTANWLIDKQRSLFKQYDLTLQQYNILRILRGQFPSPVTINLLKERMLDKMSDASRLVDRLQKKSLVERSINSVDKRVSDIVITETGLEMLNELDKVIDQFEIPFKNLSESEIKALNEYLDRIRG